MARQWARSCTGRWLAALALAGCGQTPDARVGGVDALADTRDADVGKPDSAVDALADAQLDAVSDAAGDAAADADDATADTADPDGAAGEIDAVAPADTATAEVAGPQWWEELEQETPEPLAVVGQVPCLDYDGVADGTTDEYVLPTQLFKDHMVWLYTHGYTVLTMQQYLDRLDDPDFGQKGLPPRTVLLFADVTAGTFVKNAWPILYPLGYRITLGIETGLLGQPWAMNVAQLKGLEKLGVEIASHSHSHPDLTLVSPEQLMEEVAGSRQKLQSYGFAVPHFIHPYGMRNTAVDKAILDAGYVAARSTGAPTIAGGGYSGLDPKRRMALGCALPTQNTSLVQLQEYLNNPRIELEDVVGILADAGPEGVVERSDFKNDNYLSTTLPDKGDKVRIRLLVNEAGTYDLIFHVKVGFPGVPDGSNDSYQYRVNGQDVAKELLGPDAEEPPYIVWGKHKLAKLQLAQGLVDIELESGGDWDVVLDWLQVVPSP